MSAPFGSVGGSPNNQATGTPYGEVRINELGVVDLVRGASIHHSFTCTRAGTATRRNASGLIEAVPSNTPRFDHDVNGTLLGLLVEESRTNLLTAPNDFTDVAWTATRATVSADSTTGPDGTTSADKWVDSTDNSTHLITQSITKAASALQYTFFVYAKAAELDEIRIFLGDSVSVTNSAYAFYNLTSGTPGTYATQGTGFTLDRVECREAANGFFQCVIVATTDASTTLVARMDLSDGSENTVYTGTGTNGVYVWGADLAQDAGVSSFAEATRDADGISRIVGLGAPFTELVEFRTADFAGPQVYSQYDDATANERVRLYRSPSNEIHLDIKDGGVTVADLTLGVIPNGTNATVAYRIEGNNVAASLRGATAVADAAVTLPTTTRHRLSGFNADFCNGQLKAVRRWDSGQPNAFLESLSSAQTNAFTDAFNAVSANAASLELLVIGDSTGNESWEWVYRFGQWLGENYPTHTVNYRLWNDTSGAYDAATTLSSGSGANTITIFNASVEGSTPSYLMGAKFAAAIAAVSPALIIWNHGQNLVGTSPTATDFTDPINQVRTEHPGVSDAMILQNPRRDDSNMDEVIDLQNGFKDSLSIMAVDVYSDFVALGKDASLYSDNVHPSDNGEAVYLNQITDAWKSA